MAKKIENEKTTEELQLIINDLQKKNKQLEHDKTVLTIKVNEANDKNDKVAHNLNLKIKELEVLNKRIDELKQENDDLFLLINNNVSQNEVKVDFLETSNTVKVGDNVYYPKRYSTMPFQIMGVSGVTANNEILYRIISHKHDTTENFVLSKDLQKI